MYMHELICPHCKKPFAVNEDDYAAILSQVKGAEFDAEVSRRIAEPHKQHEAEQEAREAKAGQAHQLELSRKDKVIGEKENEILRLREQLSAMGERRELELSVAVAEKEKKIAELQSQARLAASEANLREQSIVSDYEGKLRLAKSEASVREKGMKEDY